MAESTEVYYLKTFYHDQPTSHPLEVVLRHHNGYLPQIHFIVDGECLFKVCALGMEPGDEITLKAGFRYRNSLAVKTITVA